MTTATPGPWKAFPNGGDDADPRELFVCAQGGFDNDWHMIAEVDRNPVPDGDPVATARLIAAAPDILEALVTLRRICASIPAIETNARFGEANRAALAAIAKAEAA